MAVAVAILKFCFAEFRQEFIPVYAGAFLLVMGLAELNLETELIDIDNM